MPSASATAADAALPNFKPTYLGIMNYAFQTFAGCSFDFDNNGTADPGGPRPSTATA